VYNDQIHEGDHVMINFPDLDKQVESTVTVKTRAINAINRTFTIEVAINGKGMQLSPNMLAVVKINDYSNNNAFVLPLNVVQRDEKGSFIYIAEPQTNKTYQAHKHYVKAGQNYNGEIEVLNGLNPDDKVITTGYQDVTDGQIISINQ
jgi:hypothetical protein